MTAKAISFAPVSAASERMLDEARALARMKRPRFVVQVWEIASGMMKLLFPHGEITDEQFDFYCVRPGKMLRQNIWEQLQLLDGEYRQFDSQLRYEIGPS